MLVCIEGNVASGKSSLLETLRGSGATVVPEPLEAWAPFLSRRGDRSLFQCVVLAWYVIVARKYMDLPSVVYVERSPASSEQVFAATVAFECPALAACHARLLAILRTAFRPKLYVVLLTSPRECYSRLKRRAGAGDHALCLADVQRYDTLHWRLVCRLRARGALCAVI